jgi:hypothetical protein
MGWIKPPHQMKGIDKMNEHIEIYNRYNEQKLDKPTEYVYVLCKSTGKNFIIRKIEFNELKEHHIFFKKLILAIDIEFDKVLSAADKMIMNKLKKSRNVSTKTILHLEMNDNKQSERFIYTKDNNIIVRTYGYGIVFKLGAEQ